MASLLDSIFRARQAILLGIGFAILILIAGSSVWLAQQSNKSSEELTNALEIQNSLALFTVSLRRAESLQRGYLLTGQNAYRDGYLADVTLTRERFKSLRDQMASARAHNRGALDDVGRLMEDKIAEMDRVLSLYDGGNKQASYDMVQAGLGARQMDDIRERLTTISANERKIIAEQQAKSVQTDYLLLGMTAAGSALIALIGALSVMLVQRSNRDRQRALNALEATNANLERIVEFRTADLQEANEEIQRFAYIVSHDLRSPLVNIMGFTSELEALRHDIFAQVETLKADMAALNTQAERVAERGTDESARPVEELGQDFDEALGFIKTSIGKMDRLINAVLKLSREGRRQFHPETIDMDDMMDSIIRTVAHRAAEQQASVTVGNLPAVQSDSLAVEQVFSNLIDNALKYGRDGVPGDIRVDGRATATHAIYDVKDNGRGIDPHDHTRVFELFRRSGTQDRPGEGIGLAHVRALVRRLGGHMSLTSELGKGSVFTVTLPLRWSADKRSAA